MLCIDLLHEAVQILTDHMMALFQHLSWGTALTPAKDSLQNPKHHQSNKGLNERYIVWINYINLH